MTRAALTRTGAALLASLGLNAAAASHQLADTAGTLDYALLSHTLDGGGGRASGGGFVVQGSIAQPDADPLHPASGGAYSVLGGFWGGVLERPEALFEDGFEDD